MRKPLPLPVPVLTNLRIQVCRSTTLIFLETDARNLIMRVCICESDLLNGHGAGVDLEDVGPALQVRQRELDLIQGSSYIFSSETL